MQRYSRILRFLICCAICVGIVGSSAASNLTLFTDAPPGNPIEVTAGELAGPIAVGVVNDATPDAPEDFLTGWQLSLAILPEPGAIGTVTFASPSGPVAAEPTDYLLNGVNFGISASNTGNELFLFDFNFPASGGVEVPSDPGALLISLSVDSTIDARGDFGIYALAGLGGSEWTDSATGIQQSRSFLNVPQGAGSVLIGTVHVGVPEAPAFTLICIGVSAVVFFSGRIHSSLRDCDLPR